MSGSREENSSVEPAFPRAFGAATGAIAGTVAGTDPLTALGAGGVSPVESESPACAVALCNCSKKPGAPPTPGGGESGAAPVVENPAPTKGDANTATENALAPPKPDA
jgi:hypothetical protein